MMSKSVVMVNGTEMDNPSAYEVACAATGARKIRARRPDHKGKGTPAMLYFEFDSTEKARSFEVSLSRPAHEQAWRTNLVNDDVVVSLSVDKHEQYRGVYRELAFSPGERAFIDSGAAE
jgi:hypothetical protein